MTRLYWENQEAINEGLPAGDDRLVQQPGGDQGLPVRASPALTARAMRTNRPETPFYSDVTLAIQQTLHPPARIQAVAAITPLAPA